jgi:hypothetical protein
MKQRPNLLQLTTDQPRADVLGCAGHAQCHPAGSDSVYVKADICGHIIEQLLRTQVHTT